MNYIICDDNKEFAELLKHQICALQPDCRITVFTSVESLLFSIEDCIKDNAAIFMDIKMPSTDGISTASQLLTKYPLLKVVFVTGYGDEYSQDIFDLPAGFSPIAYIVKPVNEERLLKTLHRLQEVNEVKEKYISVRSGTNTFFINIAEISHISCNRRKITIHRLCDNIETYMKLSQIMEQLPDSFLQCHKGFAVNLSQIDYIQSRSIIVMKSGERIPIGKTHADRFMQRVLAFHIGQEDKI